MHLWISTASVLSSRLQKGPCNRTRQVQVLRLKCIDSPAQVASHGCTPLQIHTHRPVNISFDTTYAGHTHTESNHSLILFFARSTCCLVLVACRYSLQISARSKRLWWRSRLPHWKKSRRWLIRYSHDWRTSLFCHLTSSSFHLFGLLRLNLKTDLTIWDLKRSRPISSASQVPWSQIFVVTYK